MRASSAKERGLWCVWYLRLLHKQIKFSWYQWILGEALSFVFVHTPLCSRCKLHTHPHPTKKRYFQFVYSFIQFLTLGFICLITIYGGKWSESSDISSLEKIWRNFRNFSRSSCSIIIYFSFVTIKLHAGLHTKLRLTHKWGINAVATFICTLIDCESFFNAIHWAGNNDNCYRGNLSQELSLIFQCIVRWFIFQWVLYLFLLFNAFARRKCSFFASKSNFKQGGTFQLTQLFSIHLQFHTIFRSSNFKPFIILRFHMYSSIILFFICPIPIMPFTVSCNTLPFFDIHLNFNSTAKMEKIFMSEPKKEQTKKTTTRRKSMLQISHGLNMITLYMW